MEVLTYKPYEVQYLHFFVPETLGDRSCVFFGLLSPQDLDAKQQARAEVVAKELKDFEQRMTPQERSFPVFFWRLVR